MSSKGKQSSAALSTSTAVALVVTLSSGCVAGVDIADPTVTTQNSNAAASVAAPSTASTAKPLFESTVAPILTASCAGAACHSAPGTSPPKFMGTGQGDLYTTIIGFSDVLLAGSFDKSRAQILSKVAPGHFTARYTAANVQAISAWLDAEVAARASQTAAPSASRQLLGEWSGCMDLNDFKANGGVSAAWAQKQTNEGTCETCHVNGQGWLATRDNDRAFSILTTQLNSRDGTPFLTYYFTVDQTTDPANPKVVINRGLLDRAASGAGQHPTFTVTEPNKNNDPFKLLQAFYDKTLARKAAGMCAAPRLPSL